MEIIAHGLGIIAAFVLIMSFQIHNKKKLVVAQTIGVLCFCTHYFLIGAYSGAALNLICSVRNILYYLRTKNNKNGPLLPIILAVILIIVSAFFWDGYHSLFIIIGLTVNTLALGFLNTQNFRKSIFISCPLVLIYNIFEFSLGGIINESLSIVSAFIGIIRYIKVKKKSLKF